MGRWNGESYRRKKREDVVWAEILGARRREVDEADYIEKLKKSGGWREEYEMLLRKYGLEEAEEESQGQQLPGR